MHAKILRRKHGPEYDIQKALISYLTLKGWLVRELHGDANNYGWPDLYACHRQFAIRWIEVKLPNMKGSKFTSAQMEWFPKMSANGTGIWILTAATDHEYSKLFQPANWYHYLSVMK
jgi:hypothetical protein